LKGKTPLEAWCDEKLNENHLRVFGNIAYVHVAKELKQNLDIKNKFIFLKYCFEFKNITFTTWKEISSNDLFV
jgi:hypothetical protein